MEAIKASLRRFGQQKPIVVLENGEVVAGSGLLQAARSLGWTHLNVIRFRGTADEARAYALADNRTAELAEWDLKILLGTLDDLGDLGFNIETDLAFPKDFVADMALKLEHEAGLDGIQEVPAPAPPAEPRTKRGILYELGRHRLLCGDSASPQDVDRLLGGEPVHLVHTDPPYNVRVEPRSNNAIAASKRTGQVSGAQLASMHHQAMDLARHPEKATPTDRQMRPKDRPLENDFLSDEEFEKQLDAWFGNVARVLLPGRAFYVWGGYSNLGSFPAALKRAGLYFSQGIVWDKQWPVLTRKDFLGAFEIAFYGWREGAGHYFAPDIANATDLWRVKKVAPTSMVHLTEKPVELAARAMTLSSRPDENVLDLFGGSGSTLVAAEQMGERRAFLMELDEAYCDVIVERWERLTGQKARAAIEGVTDPA